MICNHKQKLFVSLCYYSIAMTLASGVAIHASRESSAIDEMARLSTLSSKAKSFGQAILEKASFGWFEGSSSALEEYRSKAGVVVDHRTQVIRLSAVFVVVSVCFLVAVWLMSRADRAPMTWEFIIHLTLISLICFGLGVCCDAMRFQATTRVPLLGDIVVRHEAKGILATTLRLFRAGDWLLAGILFCFSLVLPVTKAGVLLLACGLTGRYQHFALRFVKAVGKWSMVDVFVVAVLVAILGLDRDSGMAASAGPGIWFFAVYCLFAMVATLCLNRLSDGAIGVGPRHGGSDLMGKKSGLAAETETSPSEWRSTVFGIPWK